METKILIVDQDKSVLTKLEKHLSGENGYNIDVETNPFRALEMVKNSNYSIILSDYELGTINGIDFIKLVLDYRPATRVVIMTKEHKLCKMIEAIASGACDYIPRPIENISKVKTIVDNAVEIIEQWKNIKEECSCY